MARPRKENRDEVAGETLTLRLTAEERLWLQKLVELRAGELADAGGRVSKASFVRGLIRREARAAGISKDRTRREK